jgi:hypothetical protein
MESGAGNPSYSPGGGNQGGGNQGGGGGAQRPSSPSYGGGSVMTRQAVASQRAIRKPDEYLGEAFDATLRKGLNVGANHLERMMKADNLDEDTRNSLRQKFGKFREDQTLKQHPDQGITERLNSEMEGRGQNLLNYYRSGDYGKGGKYERIKQKAEEGTQYQVKK